MPSPKSPAAAAHARALYWLAAAVFAHAALTCLLWVLPESRVVYRAFDLADAVVLVAWAGAATAHTRQPASTSFTSVQVPAAAWPSSRSGARPATALMP